MPERRNLHGRDVITLIVVCVVGVIAVAYVLTPDGGIPKRARDRIRNQVNLAATGKALFNYAAARRDNRFPQLGVGSTRDNSAAGRFQELTATTTQPLLPKALINPQETSQKTVYPGQGTLTTANFSYALLVARSPEWANNGRAVVPLVSDRLIGAGSVWDSKQWTGHILWGDGHVSYKTARTLRTEMRDTTAPAGAQTQPAPMIRPADDIFSASDGGAMMEYN